jgi:hypothetical protein
MSLGAFTSGLNDQQRAAYETKISQQAAELGRLSGIIQASGLESGPTDQGQAMELWQADQGEVGDA